MTEAMTEQYDTLADCYDDRYSANEYLKENNDVKLMVDYKGGKVLDIGCGTGLFLELFNTNPDDYVGIDPSGKMLEHAHKKFPKHQFLVTDFETFPARILYDYVVCLFGGVSHINPKSINNIKRHLKPGGKYFLMFYKDDYTPEIYNGDDSCIFRENYKLIDGDDIQYHNYIIKVGIND